jgi:parallel beta-helix repeat protein
MRRFLILVIGLLAASQAMAAPITSYPAAMTPLTGTETAIGTQSGRTVQIPTGAVAVLAGSPAVITARPAATAPLTGSELIPGVQSGGAVKMTAGGIAVLARAGLVADITDYGASPAASAAANTTAVNAALAIGFPVFVPPASGCFVVNPITLPSNSIIFGAGKNSSSCLQDNAPGTTTDFITIGNSTNVTIDGLTVDGNYTSGTTTHGWTISAGVGASTYRPVNQACTIRNSIIKGNGFGAIVLNNAGGCRIQNNDVTATTDTTIAILDGSWNFVVTGNIVSGASFGISPSTQGWQHIGVTGFVGPGVISGNIATATKATSQAYEVDGVQWLTFTDNIAIVNGGGWGYRIEGYFPGGGSFGDTSVNILNSTFAHNSAVMVQDTGSAIGMDIYGDGAGDMSTDIFDGLNISAAAAQGNTTGLFVESGITGVAVSEANIANIGSAIDESQANIAGTTLTLTHPVVRGAAYGLLFNSTDANKTTVTVDSGDIQGSSAYNVYVTSGVNITMNNTAQYGSWYTSTANKYLGENSPPGTVAQLPSCSSALLGTKGAVSDLTTPTFLGAAAGSGAVVGGVLCNGSGWVTP